PSLLPLPPQSPPLSTRLSNAHETRKPQNRVQSMIQAINSRSEVHTQAQVPASVPAYIKSNRTILAATAITPSTSISSLSSPIQSSSSFIPQQNLSNTTKDIPVCSNPIVRPISNTKF